MAACDLNELEMRAKQQALEDITHEFQKPDQLDKLDLLRKQYERRKNTTEAQLKSAIQSQLDGVRNGLSKLDRAHEESCHIRTRMLDVGEAFEQLKGLSSSLQELKSECSKHTQLAAAMENMSRIVNVPDDLNRVEELISGGNLLAAHKILQQLEGSRDELMFEIFRCDPQDPGLKVLERYFAGIGSINEELKQQLRIIALRILEIVRRDAKVVVSALRIIDREERADQYWKARSELTKFVPIGRPKKLKEKFFEWIENYVAQRIAGSQLDTREETKLWLARHLEVIRRITVDDLTVVKVFCPPCFPDNYQVFHSYAAMYHEAIADHLEDLVTRDQLDDREIIQLLGWLNTYQSKEMMSHPSINISFEQLNISHPPGLMKEDILSMLQKRYFDNLRSNIGSWFPSSLEKDAEDWERENVLPESDADGYLYTELPVTMMDITNQNIALSKTIGHDVQLKLVKVFISEFGKFADQYKEKVLMYSIKNRDAEHANPMTDKYLVANINNCATYCDNVRKLAADNFPPSHPDSEAVAQKAEEVCGRYSELASIWMDILVGNVFKCLKKHFDNLINKQWLQEGNVIVETVELTILDFNNDFIHLRPAYYKQIVSAVCTRVCVTYIRAILARRISFDGPDQRRAVAQKIIDEQSRLQVFFVTQLVKDLPEARSFMALEKIAHIVLLQNDTVIHLDVCDLVRCCPDISAEQLRTILLWRGDISQRRADEIISEIMDDNRVVKPDVFSWAASSSYGH